MYGLILQNMAEYIRNKEQTGYKALKSKYYLEWFAQIICDIGMVKCHIS